LLRAGKPLPELANEAAAPLPEVSKLIEVAKAGALRDKLTACCNRALELGIEVLFSLEIQNIEISY
jgi:hypothetical protein